MEEKKTETSPQSKVPTAIVSQQDNLPQEHLDIDLWIKTRAEFKTKVGSIMLEGSDFHVIQGRKSLAKGGAEKIASIFGWAADFVMDHETLTMVGKTEGILAYVCDLKDRTGRIVGQGRGAASLQKNGGDVNKAVKMAQKSAFIDSVLRASGLSDIYTQDLEDMPHDQVKATPLIIKNGNADGGSFPPSEAQLTLISKVMKEKGLTKADIIDAGFGKLTGGKDGTASELIGWLFDYKKPVETDQVIDILNQEGIGATL